MLSAISFGKPQNNLCVFSNSCVVHRHVLASQRNCKKVEKIFKLQKHIVLL